VPDSLTSRAHSTRWLRRLLIPLGTLLGVAVVTRLRGPAVVHDAAGTPWYRARGEDAAQEAIDTCARMNGRTVIYDDAALVARARGKSTSGERYCCARLRASECDQPPSGSR